MEVPKETWKDWGSCCDETFHGPGKLHDPEQGLYVVAYNEIKQQEFQLFKHKIFDKYGGI